MATKDKVNVFFAYSQRDRELKSELERHLSLLKRNRIIETWSDNEIIPGQVWEDEIFKRLKTADIILLLISADFLASDYCYNEELTLALERHKQGSAYVIPILLRSCAFKDSPFSHLQYLPRDGNFVGSKNRDIDEAFTEVVNGIKKSVDDLIQRKINEADYFSYKETAEILFLDKKYAEAKDRYERAFEIINNPDINNKIKICEEFIRNNKDEERKFDKADNTEYIRTDLKEHASFTTSDTITKQIERIKYFKDAKLYKQGLGHSKQLLAMVQKDSKEAKLLKKYIIYFSAFIK